MILQQSILVKIYNIKYKMGNFFQESEESSVRKGEKYIKCPLCNNEIVIEKNERILLPLPLTNPKIYVTITM